ncbi:N-acetylmuramyl-L-alanine amidase, negative regulator of AmpC, AmpD [Psychromonas ingrahamii 37]|uniref:1,6-anhydro-N-acetylmuramyl-L-alanine amidase AmpD n=1 Tax=Psychromonas ingrahamii (strain DSM 17664 / CCUG 51855 / 37) TaxID=357804 RepID=A1SYS7_PSYIN|nr:1,6-anhydro-N-acetylmuramyl-L-alanine amidase AmpD [Psychromonas ingrahamii]ABM04642.1 N-acetylmuramyl-L-alanine amidase, negative regulator of AmpC, AmpD [Psychromonas ingrahamii 37]
MINKLGFYQNARQISSPFYNQRPAGSEISLLVIHCISLPEGCYGGPEIESLFTGCLDCYAHPDFSSLEGLEVSAHCVIRRNGEIEQYVPFEKGAWHAGASYFAGVDRCNDYSIGIELEGTDKSAYTERQYRSLATLTQKIQQRYPAISKQRIVAHSEIAPGRKTDPGSGFDWVYYLSLLSD